ncbi:unnamed protein product, partial [Phaeothamnion confervicola]
MNVTTGTLINALGATIRSTGVTGATNTLNAQVTNLGTIDVQQPMKITNTGRTFTTSAGTINVAAGQTLSVFDGTTSVGTGTVLTGSGTFGLTGTAALDLASNFTLPGAGGVALDLNAGNAVTVSSATPGTQFVVPVGGTQTLYNDTFAANVDLVNNGTVAVTGVTSTSTINGGLSNAAGATIRVSDQSIPPGTATLTVANGFTNDGLIELVNNAGNCCGPRSGDMNVTTGTLINALGATIRS